MKNTSKRAQALKILSGRGIKPSVYMPLYWRLAWHLNFALPPPHFATFTANLFMHGGFFFFISVTSQIILELCTSNVLNLTIAFDVFVGSAVFGIVVSFYYAQSKKKNNFPNWDTLRS